MKKYEATVRDREGNTVAGAEVYIRDSGTGNLISPIYADNGVTPKTNPLTSDNDGYVFAYVPDGTLKVQVFIDGSMETERPGIQHYDATDPEIAAIRSVTSAADKGFHFTGSGTGATHDLSPYARTLLDDADAASARSTLGLGTAATAAVGDFLVPSNNLSDIGNAATARTNLGVSNLRPISFFFASTPSASEVLLIFVAAQSITLADDFAGSTCAVGTNPTSSFALDVQRNGVSVGTITISNAGAVTFVTSGTTVALSSGDTLSVVAPFTPDATVANVAITFKGTN